MPPFLLAILAKVGPVIAQALFKAAVSWAQKAGIVNKLEATAITDEHDIVSAMETLKIYHAPSDFPSP